MKINVKFFASLREQTGKSDYNLDSDQPLSILQIWQQSTGIENLPENTLCALDMEYVEVDTLVSNNAEVAFFPPVTGGLA